MRDKAQEPNPRCSRALQTSPFSQVLGGMFPALLRFCILFVGFYITARLDLMLLKPLKVFPTYTEAVASPFGITGSENAALGNLFVTRGLLLTENYLHVQTTLSHLNPCTNSPCTFPFILFQVCSGSGQLWVTQGHRAHEGQRDWSSQLALAPAKGDKNGKIKQIFCWFCWFASCPHKILSKQGDWFVPNPSEFVPNPSELVPNLINSQLNQSVASLCKFCGNKHFLGNRPVLIC